MEEGVGIVELRKVRLDLPEGGLRLAYGGVLPEVEVAYEMCGAPYDGTNAIYICHALTGDAHVAGIRPGETQPSGWWEGMIGPGRAIDTRRWCVICATSVRDILVRLSRGTPILQEEDLFSRERSTVIRRFSVLR